MSGQINELQKLAMLAPVIDFAGIFDITPSLPPIAHGGQLAPGRGAALPEVEKHWLARPRSQTRQWWDKTVRRADILAVRDAIGVCFNERPRVAVTFGKLEFMADRIGT